MNIRAIPWPFPLVPPDVKGVHHGSADRHRERHVPPELRARDRDHAQAAARVPSDRAEYRPHEKSRSARELAWIFVSEQGLATRAIDGTLNFGGGGAPPPAP